MFNPLFSASQWDWQPHCKLGQSILVVLCAGSMLLIDAGSAPYHKSASSNLQKWILSPTDRLNFDFKLRKNLLLCSSYLTLGVSQRVLWDIKMQCSPRTIMQFANFLLRIFCFRSLLTFKHLIIQVLHELILSN
jgi:hypothetical protein